MTRLVRPGLPSARQLVLTILEKPNLIRAVRELPGPVLARLIDSIGLEDAAEIVALAGSEQLETIFDEDLWQVGTEGWEERFDPARFGLWLHAFSEAGEAAVVARLTELPFDLLTLAVSRLVLVIDIDALGVELSEGDDELDGLEKALDSHLYEEWEEFRLIARDTDAWDELVHALLALDREHHDVLRRILERCAAMSSEWIADNGGLYRVLSSDEMLEGDVRAERDDRRSKKGYVSPADARAFLTLGWRVDGPPNERDAVTRAYFRELERETKPQRRSAAPARGAPKADVNALMKLLTRARVIEDESPSPRKPRAKLGKAAKASSATALVRAAPASVFERAAAELREQAPASYAERMEELGYLANVLVSASQSERRHLRPVEALEIAMAIVEHGLSLALSAADSAAMMLRATPLDVLFRTALRDLDAGPAASSVAALAEHARRLRAGEPRHFA